MTKGDEDKLKFLKDQDRIISQILDLAGLKQIHSYEFLKSLQAPRILDALTLAVKDREQTTSKSVIREIVSNSDKYLFDCFLSTFESSNNVSNLSLLLSILSAMLNASFANSIAFTVSDRTE